MPGSVVPDVAAVHMIERGISGLHGVEQIAPGSPEVGTADQLCHRSASPRNVAAQVFTHGGEHKSVALGLPYDPDRNERPHEPMEPIGVHAGGGSQLGCARRNAMNPI